MLDVPLLPDVNRFTLYMCYLLATDFHTGANTFCFVHNKEKKKFFYLHEKC